MKFIYRSLLLALLQLPITLKAQLGIIENPTLPSVSYGGSVTYSGSINVTGNVSNVHVVKTLPPGLKFIYCNAPSAISCSSSPANPCGGETVDFNFGNLSGGSSGSIFIYTIRAIAVCPAYIPNTITYTSSASAVTGTGVPTAYFPAGAVTQAPRDPLSHLALNKQIMTQLPFYNNFYHAFYDQTVRYKIWISSLSCPPACCASVMPTITNINITDNLPPTAVLSGPVLDASSMPIPAANYSLVAGVLTISNYSYTICQGTLEFYVDIKIPCPTTPPTAPFPNTVLDNKAKLSFNSPALHTNYTTSNTVSFIIEKKEAKAQLKKTNLAPTGTCPAHYGYNLEIVDTGTVKLDNYCITDVFPPEIIVDKIITPVSASCSYTIRCKFVNMNNTSPDAGWTTYSGSPVVPATTILIPGSINPPPGKKLYAIEICAGGINCNIPAPTPTYPNYLHSESTKIYYTIDPVTASGTVITNNITSVAHAFDNTPNSCNDPVINEMIDATATAASTYNPASFSLTKSICTSKPCYNIGDTLIFDFALRNNGSGGAIIPTAHINDILYSNGLQFISTLRTYISHSVSPSDCPSGGPASTDISTITTTTYNYGSIVNAYVDWNLPAGWLQGTCPVANDSTIHIRFSARVLPTGAGTHVNNGGYASGSWTNSNNVTFNVCSVENLIYTKDVSTDGGITWSNTATATGGTTVQYRLKLQNNGTYVYPITATNPLIFTDVFPNNSNNERTLPLCGSRGSNINLTLPLNSSTNFEVKKNGSPLAGGNYNYFDNYNADLGSYAGSSPCNTTASPFSNTTSASPHNKAFSYKVATPSITAINPGDYVEIFIRNITIPVIPNGTSGQACNTFAVKVGTTAPGESNNVCLSILPPCLCSGWSGTLSYTNSSGTTVSYALVCNNSPAMQLNCNTLYTITPALTCNQAACIATIDSYTIDGITASFTGTSFNIGPFNSPGSHTVVVNGHCGASVCSCTYTFVVPPCPVPPVCPQPCNYNLSVDSVSTVQVIPAATGSTYTIFNTTLNLNTLGVNISEVRVNVIDFSITDANGLTKCLECYNYPVFWGSPQGGALGSISPIYTAGAAPAITITGRSLNGRELIWNSLAPFSANSAIPLAFNLPLGNSLPCCKLKATICLKISIRKPDCTECIFYKCVSTLL